MSSCASWVRIIHDGHAIASVAHPQHISLYAVPEAHTVLALRPRWTRDAMYAPWTDRSPHGVARSGLTAPLAVSRLSAEISGANPSRQIRVGRAKHKLSDSEGFVRAHCVD